MTRRQNDVILALKEYADSEKAKFLLGFFKCAPGQYGEGDRFLGITVPAQRTVAGRFKSLDENSIQELLDSPFHEHRLTGLFILVHQFKKAGFEKRQQIYNFCLDNYKAFNNWDLVDELSPKILGVFALDNLQEQKRMTQWVSEDNLWKRRMSIMSMLAFIRENNFDLPMFIIDEAKLDHHDLIHKASGWMLREVAKRDIELAEGYLEANASLMPRTMLRYAIEKFPQELRAYYRSL